MKEVRVGICACVLLMAACGSNKEAVNTDPVDVADAGNQFTTADAGQEAGREIPDAGPSEPVFVDAGYATLDAEVFIEDASGQNGKDPECSGVLKATIRDFKVDHADFEGPGANMVNKGIVKNELGADHKPVYAPAGATVDTSGPAGFAEWYNDVPGVNQASTVEIALTQSRPGLFVYDSTAFFPIDGQGFGNENNPHNFHFTTEIHTRFTYKGGEVFTFRGDDDLWAFVNGKLAIDLGGLHQPQEQTINFDQRAAELGLKKGETYPLDIFHAERHTVDSNFHIETSIGCFTNVVLF